MRIGELAAAGAVTTKTVRFYEEAGLLPAPPRAANGYRDYPPRTVPRLAFIRTAQSAGLSLAEIRSVLALRDDGRPPCDHVAALVDRHLTEIDRRLAELRQTRDALRDLSDHAARFDPSACSEDDVCSILRPTHAGTPR